MRITSYRRILAIMNDIQVRPFIEAELGIPVDEDTYYIEAGAGAILFINKGDYFDVHTALMSQDKNKAELCRKAVVWMKANAGLTRCVCKVHLNNRKARLMARVMGMIKINQTADHIYYEGVG